MTEKDIEAYFVKRVKALGGYSYKFRSVTQRGVADRVACLPNGETWFVELKKPGGRLSPLQELFAENMAEMNQNYALLWSKGDVDKWIERFNHADA
jgi:hypothetical protein